MINNNEAMSLGHIAVITNDYPAFGHIRYVFVQQLVNAFIDQGAMISVIAPQSLIHSLVHREKLFPITSIGRTPGGKEYKIYRPYIITLGNSRLFSNFLKWWNGYKLTKVLKKISPNILYAHFWSSAQLVLSFAEKQDKPLFVACGEGDDAMEEMVQSLSAKELTRLRTAVKGVISVSSENKRKCIGYHLVNDMKIEVFPNCVDTEVFSKKDMSQCRTKLGLSKDDFVIVFVGVFMPRKGPDKLAEAISSINSPSIKVLFLGKEVPGYPLAFDCPGIAYKGPVEHDELPVFLSAADIFVLPTQKEGCCNAIVEALSIGVPVVSSIGAFNDDILNDENSIRVDPNSVSAIKNAILSLMNNSQLRLKMSDYSLSRHATYSIKDRATRIIGFMHKCL